MYSNSGGVTLLQNARKAWLLWAVSSPLALWSVLWRDTNRRRNCASPTIYIYRKQPKSETDKIVSINSRCRGKRYPPLISIRLG